MENSFFFSRRAKSFISSFIIVMNVYEKKKLYIYILCLLFHMWGTVDMYSGLSMQKTIFDFFFFFEKKQVSIDITVKVEEN